jgi:hypothetical protein
MVCAIKPGIAARILTYQPEDTKFDAMARLSLFPHAHVSLPLFEQTSFPSL